MIEVFKRALTTIPICSILKKEPYSYYLQLLPPLAQQLILFLTLVYLILGFQYFLVRNLLWPQLYIHNTSKAITALRYLSRLPYQLYRLLFTPPRKPSDLLLKPDAKTRTALLSIVVKYFFFPLMISFFSTTWQPRKTSGGRVRPEFLPVSLSSIGSTFSSTTLSLPATPPFLLLPMRWKPNGSRTRSNQLIPIFPAGWLP